MSAEYTETDVRFAPAYQLAEASRYIHVPARTLWNWFKGLDDKPVLHLAERDAAYISFIGLMEAHVLSSMRVAHGVSLARIRKAIEYLKIEFHSEHPLIEFEFQTNGIDLFIEEIGTLTNVSRFGQIGMRDVLTLFLSRIERDDSGLPIRFFPFTQESVESDPKIVVMDPRVSFGRPMIGRTGVTTAAITARFKTGESIGSLADDFSAKPQEIEAAIRSEFEIQLAA